MKTHKTMTYSPSPWRACHDGTCKCKQVWTKTADHPVAVVESGGWGDSHWTAQLVDGEAKLVWEEMDYGNIPEEVAVANARLIAKSPEMYEALEKVDTLLEAGDIEGAMEVTRKTLASVFGSITEMLR